MLQSPNKSSLKPSHWFGREGGSLFTRPTGSRSPVSRRRGRTAIVQLLVGYTEKNGIDLFVGRKLPNLLRSAGLMDICVKPLIHVYPPGAARRNILLNFAENLSERILADGFVERPELDRLKEALRHDLDDPNRLVISNLFLQAWGRKPA